MPKLDAPAEFGALVVYVDAPLPAAMFRPEVVRALLEAGARVVDEASAPHDIAIALQPAQVTHQVQVKVQVGDTHDATVEFDYGLAVIVTEDGRLVDEISARITERSEPMEALARANHAYAWVGRSIVAQLVAKPKVVALATRLAKERGHLAVADASASGTDEDGATVATPTGDERRVALVIGNAAYREGRLANPVNDAKAMAKALRAVGFTVAEKHDLDQRQMKIAIVAFGRQLRRGGVGLFYFAGHGLQVEGHNYLVPLGADLRSEAHVDVEAVALKRVLAEIDGAGNRLNVVILDACRNNPFARSFRSPSRGLAFVDAPQGTLIAYATAPGSTAADGKGGQGTYTAALVKHLATPGLPVESVFKSVRRDVQRATGGTQVPWESSSLTGELYFLPRP
jgi:hypothetical protein